MTSLKMTTSADKIPDNPVVPKAQKRPGKDLQPESYLQVLKSNSNRTVSIL
jgi:hypothetical protein